MSEPIVFTPSFSPESRYLLRDQEECDYFARYGGAPEAPLIDWATELIRRDHTFIDVGAHVGTWTQHFAQRCATVHAFEPQRSTFERLRDGALREARLTNVVCHDVALGGRGHVDLNIVSIDGGGSTLKHRQEIGDVLEVERVIAMQLDDYNFENVGLIKVDAEGSELAILRGAKRTIETHRPKLLLEAWNHDWYTRERAELIGYVESIGYRVSPVKEWPEMLIADPVATATTVDVKRLFATIEASLPEGEQWSQQWCTLDKAFTLASMILSLRPEVVVELGVWMGGSAVPMALALQAIGSGQLTAIDAWAPDASVEGQEGNDKKWWGDVGTSGHNMAHDAFMRRLAKQGISSARCRVVRSRTDLAEIPQKIDILHHDANHGPQAVVDIERWAPAVRVGGLLIIDDINWTGGHVNLARDRAKDLGFIDLFLLGTGCVMQRVIRINPGELSESEVVSETIDPEAPKS